MAFMDQDGNVKPVTLNPDGSVPVDDGSEKTDLEVLFGRVLLELTAIRLGVQALVNEGSDDQKDFLEEAVALRDPVEES